MENLEIDAVNLSKTLLEVCQSICDAVATTRVENQDLPDLDTLNEGLARFCQIILHLDQPSDKDSHASDELAGDLDELGDYGLGLIDKLMAWADWLEMDVIRETLDDLIITVGVWSARHLGEIKQIEPVVSALSKVANNNSDPDFLAELSQIYREIANAVSPEVKQDLLQSKIQHPWRILNLNYGIVATRSHDTVIMEQAFEQLLVRLDDEDARGFFREGLEQMDTVGYPDHVRHIMEKYFQITNNPTIH